MNWWAPMLLLFANGYILFVVGIFVHLFEDEGWLIRTWMWTFGWGLICLTDAWCVPVFHIPLLPVDILGWIGSALLTLSLGPVVALIPVALGIIGWEYVKVLLRRCCAVIAT